MDEKAVRNELSGLSEEMLKLRKVTFPAPARGALPAPGTRHRARAKPQNRAHAVFARRPIPWAALAEGGFRHLWHLGSDLRRTALPPARGVLKVLKVHPPPPVKKTRTGIVELCSPPFQNVLPTVFPETPRIPAYDINGIKPYGITKVLFPTL